MDTFVTEENEMWKMPAKERIETIIVSSEESAGLSVPPPPPPHSLEDVQVKRNTRRLLHSNHPYYRNVAKHLWRDRMAACQSWICFPLLQSYVFMVYVLLC